MGSFAPEALDGSSRRRANVSLAGERGAFARAATAAGRAATFPADFFDWVDRDITFFFGAALLIILRAAGFAAFAPDCLVLLRLGADFVPVDFARADFFSPVFCLAPDFFFAVLAMVLNLPH